MKLKFILIFALLVAQSCNANVEKHAFRTEVSRMMKLIINSLYTSKEIFLRELISNASDALDKIRVISLKNNQTLDSLGELTIRVKADEEKNQVHIIDTGIGMTREELLSNLGTIAKSGTSEFLKQNLESGANLNDLIGQFGVGFYSSFLVADKVSVRSKSYNNDTEYIWESDSTEFTLRKSTEDSDLERGTVITLNLKEEAKDFLKEATLRDLIKKYSQFISFPIHLWTSKTVKEKVPADEKTQDEDTESKDKKPIVSEVEKTVNEWEKINVDIPIWHRKPTEEEKVDFYKSLTRDTQPPLASSHFTAEGELTFKALLYIPKIQPGDSINKFGSKNNNIKLHVRRVLISDELELVPSYLAFVRGVVDSDDLPLNIGRENLQQNKLIKVIKKKLIRKTLDMIKSIDEDQYVEFWKEYGTNMKLGIEDNLNRNRIAKLLRFHSSKTGPDAWTSLSKYVQNMPADQEQILYIAGASYDEVSKSPFIERILKKGYEVLYLTDAIDEYALSNLHDFENKKFQNIAKEFSLEKSKKAESYKKALETKFSKLTKWFKETALKDKVHKVVMSEKLSDTPAALVATAFGWTGNMERLATSNAYSKTKDVTRDFYLQQKKILELNPYHPLIKELLHRVDADENDEKAKDVAEVLFATATVRSGYMLQQTEDFGKSLDTLMRLRLEVPEDAPIEEDDIDLNDDEHGEEKDSKKDEVEENRIHGDL